MAISQNTYDRGPILKHPVTRTGGKVVTIPQ
jgi:hypothetical protein